MAVPCLDFDKLGKVLSTARLIEVAGVYFWGVGVGEGGGHAPCLRHTRHGLAERFWGAVTLREAGGLLSPWEQGDRKWGKRWGSLAKCRCDWTTDRVWVAAAAGGGALDGLHVVGGVQTQLPVVQATLAPALLVLLLQLGQLVALGTESVQTLVMTRQTHRTSL